MRNDIRDPLATKRSLFVSFWFILEPSSDILRLTNANIGYGERSLFLKIWSNDT